MKCLEMWLSLALLTVAANPAMAGDFDDYKDLPFSSSPPSSCPPEGLSALKNFNLTSYVSGRWYIQQQMPVSYLDEDSLYCVSARYEVTSSGDEVSDAAILQPLLSALKYNPGEVRINVYNYANRKQVNGEPQIGNIRAVVPKPQDRPAELLVGPSFIPRLFWGPYWIVAAGPGPDKYDWAIVSGGLPKNEGQDGYCKTGEGINNSGLWIFTRETLPSAETVDKIRDIAKGLGYDTSVMLPVDQEGCLYTDIQNA